MKKLIVILIALMVFFASLVGKGQTSNKEIANTILQNKEANEKLGVKDPDQIKPGETLIYTEGDGKNHFVKVQDGDNQWQIVKNLKEREFQPQEILATPQPPVATENSDSKDYLWIAIIIAMGLLIACLVIMLWKKLPERDVDKQEVDTSGLDPVNSGTSLEKNKGDFNFKSLAEVAERALVINGGKLFLEVTNDGLVKFELEISQPVKILATKTENSNHVAVEAANQN